MGAFTNLDNAKALCNKLGAEYFVFDNAGKIIYSPSGENNS
jgi:hypothetical protein